VDSLKQLLSQLLHIVFEVGNLLVAGIIAVEAWLRGVMTGAGLPEQLQSVVLIVIAVLLVVSCLRLFGGLIRIAVVLILLLVALHFLAPMIPPPT
jgi:hypothetical protein